MKRIVAVFVSLLGAHVAAAGPALHPPVRLLDDQGRSVLESGAGVSAMQSCAGCHDTQFIVANSTHHGMTRNCFLCHLREPDDEGRRRAMRSGRHDWAATALLGKTGLVEQTADGWQWARQAFSADGFVAQQTLGIQKSKSTHCGSCHGLVRFGPEPVTLDEALLHWRTAHTGQIFSPQRISESGINLADKSSRTRPWDVHAERLLQCSNCHPSANNPAFARPLDQARPAHLQFDARRLEVDQYLMRPSHRFVHGEGDSMRRCNACHQVETAHAWLPYQERHMQSLSCEACHIPEVASPAILHKDHTLLALDRKPRVEYRGIDGPVEDTGSLVRGYRPVLLPRRERDGAVRLLPYNVVASWRWVAGQPERPVEQAQLEAALFQQESYHPDVLAALDADRDGRLRPSELVLDSSSKVQAIARRLEAVGVRQARIQAELQPHALHHGVVGGRWATRDCSACHSRSETARFSQPFVLATAVPGGVVPHVAGLGDRELLGDVATDGEGRLVYRPSSAAAGLYVLGHDRIGWIDWLGGLGISATLLGIAIHAALRIRAWRTKEAVSP